MTEERRGVELWKEHTSAFDRVRSVAQSLDRPRQSNYIADEAAVSPTTANDHLERLVEMNILRTVTGKNATLYEPDPLYVRLQTLRALLDENDRNELLEHKAEIQEQIEERRETYGVDSPDELRGAATGADTAAETRDLRWEANDWELDAYHLSILEDAIENYADYTRSGRAHA